MEITASSADVIPWILISVLVPIIIFTLIPILIIRSVLKAVKSKMPAGVNFNQLREVARQLPKGTNWQKITSEWDFKMDPATKRLTLKRKPNAPTPQGSSLPNEIQLSSLSELPKVLEQMGIKSSASTTTIKTGRIESKEPPSPKPASASSRISATRSSAPASMQSPKTYETIQTIKKVAIVLLILGIFAGLKSFLA